MLVAGPVLLVFLLLAGAIYQAVAQAADAKRFPQQGRSVVLGPAFPGVSLNINCTGAGSPVVVLESGAGVPAVGWSPVQAGIAKFTRVCSYDRAGYGWSTPGPMPRTTLEIARELHALLVASGERAPYLMVGHSIGGYNVRVYNHEYPGEVVGMVLVDSTPEDSLNRMVPAMRAWTTKQIDRLRTYKILGDLAIRFGAFRLRSALSSGTTSDVSRDLDATINYLQWQTKFFDAFISESACVYSECADETRASGNLGDMPLIVLTAGIRNSTPALASGITRKDIDDFNDLVAHDLQVQQAHLSSRGTQVFVADSDHMIPFRRPDAVVTAVRDVYMAIE
jgi:pimeloyl-ACP methyl ester carboxylesterase